MGELCPQEIQVDFPCFLGKISVYCLIIKSTIAMSIRKEYLTDKGVCRVKFSLQHDIANISKKACVVGDFNNWDREQTPMIKNNNGIYSVTVELKAGKEYQFRYLIDETRWGNDKTADKHVPSPFQDSQNSVVVI